MNAASVLHVEVPALPVWSDGGSGFVPTIGFAQGIKRAVMYLAGPVGGVYELEIDRRFQRECMALASPLVEQIHQFTAAVRHGDEVIAAGASQLVRQEATRLAVEFAAIGMTAVGDRDEVAMPSVHQAATGAVQFEWHRHSIDLEIAVLPSGRIVGFVERDGEEPRDLELSSGMQSIQGELETVLRR